MIDDSASMIKNHWEPLVETFRALAYIASIIDTNGIELYFASEPDKRHHSVWTRAFHNAMDSNRNWTKTLIDMVTKRGKKPSQNSFMPMERSLSQILERVKGDLSRETSIYILTDALWDHGETADLRVCGVDGPIRSLIEELRNQNKMRDHVSLQFVLFGDNPISKERMTYLDDELPKELENL